MLNSKALAASVSAPPAVYVEDVFNTYLYTGTGSTPQTLTTGVNLADNEGMVMYRARAGSFPLGTYTQAALFSDFCFATKYARLVQDSTGDPFSSSTAVDTWTTSGVTLDYDYDQYNRSGNSYVAYTFRNADKFFQAYDGQINTYSSPVTISFPTLNTLGMVVVQGTDAISSVYYIYVWHRSLSAGKLLKLNTTGAQLSSSFISVSGADVTLDPLAINPSGTFGAAAVYAFAHDAGGYGASGADSIVKCSSYTGTGTTLQINCGFTAGAKFVIIKRADSTGDWYVWDTARGIVSGNDPLILLNNANLETSSTDYIDPYAAGFEISSSAPAAINASGGSFIYIAIA
jgi:hypothetical protein